MSSYSSAFIESAVGAVLLRAGPLAGLVALGIAAKLLAVVVLCDNVPSLAVALGCGFDAESATMVGRVFLEGAVDSPVPPAPPVPLTPSLVDKRPLFPVEMIEVDTSSGHLVTPSLPPTERLV